MTVKNAIVPAHRKDGQPALGEDVHRRRANCWRNDVRADNLAPRLESAQESDDGTGRTAKLSIIKSRKGRRGKVGMEDDMPHDHFEETYSEHLRYLETVGKDKGNEN